jgi:hypothetical protein
LIPNVSNGHNLCFRYLVWEFDLGILVFFFQQIFNGLNKTQFGQGLGPQTLIQNFKTLVIPNSQIGFN